MPNWCYNTVSFENEHDFNAAVKIVETEGNFDFNQIVPLPDELRNSVSDFRFTKPSMLAYLSAANPENKDFKTIKKLSKADFKKAKTLCNITKLMSKADIVALQKEYAKNYKSYHQNAPESVLDFGKTAVNYMIKYGSTDWYEWCLENWGTKWNARES